MAIPEPAPAPDRSTPGRLDSWKEIAVYLRRGERTVRRWELTEGLPVHRHSHQKQATVYAFRSELDAWLANRGEQLKAAPPARAGWSRRHWILITTSLLVTFAAAIAWHQLAARESPPSVTVTPLTSLPGKELYPSLSPDDKVVAFSWAREGSDDSDIYILRVGTPDARRLTHDPADEIAPAWSPDGRMIAFLRVVSDRTADVIVVDSEGGPERTVGRIRGPFAGAEHFGGWLAWSPDGKWLAVPDQPSPADPAGLFLLSPDSGAKHRLTSRGQTDRSPSFSPDGRGLAFVRVSSAFSDIFVLPLTVGYQPGGSPRQITFDRMLATSPAWSRDGKTILFSGRARWGGRRIYQVDASGTEGSRARRTPLPFDIEDSAVFSAPLQGLGRPGRLVYEKLAFDPNIWMLELSGRDAKAKPARRFASSTRVDYLPQFSADGNWIAFVSARSGRQEIWVSNRDGSHVRQLTFTGNEAGSPRWSPDGRWIAFDARVEGQGGIYVINSAGGQARRVAYGVVPCWSRDGKWIYFSGSQIRKMAANPPFTTSSAETPVTSGGVAAFESADGKLLYFFRGGSLWKTPAGGGAEQQVLPSIHNWASVAAVDHGIFFIPKSDPGASYSIQFYDFSSGGIRRVADIRKPAFVGLSASADGRSILYTQIDRDESDLMLAEIR